MPPYRIIRPLVDHGRCGVFECERTDGTIFIVKQLSSNTTDVAAARFEREIRLASSVSHPNVIRVIDVEPGANPTWFVMPKYDCSLADRLKDIRGQPHLIHPIFTSLLRGVARLHWHAIVHRDLKPENVLLNLPRTSAMGRPSTDEPDLVVADFGTSRDVATSARLTMSGQALGTDFYMAPEVRAMGASRADCRSDIFALGGILSALYTGLPVWERRESRDCQAPPFEILRLMNKARAWMPDRRYQTVPELQRAWRLAAMASEIRRVADGHLDGFGEQLRQAGASADDVGLIVNLLGRSDAASQQVYDTLLQVQSTTMGSIALRNPVLARRLVWVFVDHIEANDVVLADAPAIVRRLRVLARDVHDAVCQGILAAALLLVGQRRSDPDAVRAFEAFASSAVDRQPSALLREALLDFDPDRVMQAKNALETSGLAKPARELLSSL